MQRLGRMGDRLALEMRGLTNRGFVSDSPGRVPEALATLASSAASLALAPAAGGASHTKQPSGGGQGKMKGLGKMFSQSFLSKENFFFGFVANTSGGADKKVRDEES